MEQKLFSVDLPESERRDNLESICYSVERRIYHKALTEEEAQNWKDLFTQTSIKNHLIEQELSAIKDQFKERFKPVKETLKECLDTLKNNGVATEGNVYLIPDHDAGMMGYYDETGTLISIRRLLPEEKQNNLFLNNFKNVM